jgi:hypothetical protein
MNRPSVYVVVPVLVIMALALIALNLITPFADANAQEDAPAPPVSDSPPQDTAAWTVDQMTFESNYPDGFTFRIQASSSGGPIVSARAEWTHRPNTRPDRPLQVRRADGEIDFETGLITATWSPTGSSNRIPPWVGVDYHWQLRDEAGNEFITEMAFAEYEDNSKDWIRLEADEVIVFSNGLPEEIPEMVVEAMAVQRQKYEDGWGQLLPYRPRVILFGDMDTWLEWQTGYQDTSGLGVIAIGWTSDVWGGTTQVLYGSSEDLAYGTVLHEVEHLYQSEFLAARISFTPGWFIEGDAVFYQMDDRYYAVNYVTSLINAGRLPVLLQGTGPTIIGENALHGYYMGYTFWAYLEERWGLEIHRTIMDLLAEDMPFVDAMEQATGMSIEELESGWRVSLGAPAQVPTLIPTWTPAFPVIVTPTPMKPQ